LIPNPFSTQAYNRYSYVYNNPMNFTDPDGENPIAWILGGGILLFKWWNDGKQANHGEPNPFKWDYKNANYVVGYSSQGNTFTAGMGWNNNYGVMVGYGSDYGFGGGYSSNGNPNLYYPGYDNRINNSFRQAEQSIDATIDNARRARVEERIYEAKMEFYAGLAATGASQLYYSKQFGTWMGKDFKFRTIYGRAGNGNQYVGGKNKFGKATSDIFKWINRGVGAYSAYDIYEEYWKLDKTQFCLEEGSNFISTAAPGLYGAAWSVGWESGRWVTQQTWYQRAKFNFYYNYWESCVGPPSSVNEASWEYFYNNYR